MDTKIKMVKYLEYCRDQVSSQYQMSMPFRLRRTAFDTNHCMEPKSMPSVQMIIMMHNRLRRIHVIMCSGWTMAKYLLNNGLFL